MTKNTKILIVEDVEMFQTMIQATFVQYNCLTASSGEEAIELVTGFMPDLIIMDIQMPGIDGYETCQQIKSNEQTKGIPILFLSQLQDSSDRLKAFASGGDDYINKPFDQDELRLKSQKIIDNREHIINLNAQLLNSQQLSSTFLSNSTRNQIICEFSRCCQYINDISTASELLLSTITTLGIHVRFIIPCLSTDNIFSNYALESQLENEILLRKTPNSFSKIHHYGTNRAYFSWKNIKVLVREVNDDADHLALLVDAFEDSMYLINATEQLMSKFNDINIDNNLTKDEISDFSVSMGIELKQLMNTMGISINFSQDDEDKIDDFIATYNTGIIDKLSRLSKNNALSIDLINELRKAPESVNHWIDNINAKNDENYLF